MSEDNLTKCAHGITKADRRLVGCGKCDAERHEEFLAAQEAAKFRVRVIQTARAVLPRFIDPAANEMPDIHLLLVRTWKVAEAFERAADAYLKDGGSK